MAAQRADRRPLSSCTWGIVMQGALLFTSPAWSQERWQRTVAVTTDYVYRGVSQTRGEPALQGGLQVQLPRGWSAAAWASTIDYGGPSGHELDLQLAHTWSLNGDWSAQLALTHYDYSTHDAGYDYDELSATLTYGQRIAASVSWSPNTSRYGAWTLARDRPAIAYELSLLQPLSARWSLSAGAGHYDLEELFGTGYWFWSGGVTFQWQSVQVDLLHIGTDEAAEHLFGYGITGPRWSAVLSWRF
jgi:uncharacterized protein (TIGR02001 family)